MLSLPEETKKMQEGEVVKEKEYNGLVVNPPLTKVGITRKNKVNRKNEKLAKKTKKINRLKKRHTKTAKEKKATKGKK